LGSPQVPIWLEIEISSPGAGRQEVQRGATIKEVPFKEAYNMFPAIRKNWLPDGTAKT